MKRRDLLSTGLAALAASSVVPVALGRAVTMSAEERVRHHFAGLADAMNEITRDTTHGWYVQAGDRNGDGRQVAPRRWFNAKGIMLCRDPDPRFPSDFLIEQHVEEALGSLSYFDQPSDRPLIAPIGLYQRAVIL